MGTATAWVLVRYDFPGKGVMNALIDLPFAVPTVVTGLMLVALYGFGFAFAAIVLLLRDANAIIDISNYVVSMLSGGQFPVSVLPRFLLVVSFAVVLLANRLPLLGGQRLPALR